jgi:hypothetical protein
MTYTYNGIRDLTDHLGREYEVHFRDGIDCDLHITLIDGKDEFDQDLCERLTHLLAEELAQEASDSAGEYDSELYY